MVSVAAWNGTTGGLSTDDAGHPDVNVINWANGFSGGIPALPLVSLGGALVGQTAFQTWLVTLDGSNNVALDGGGFPLVDVAAYQVAQTPDKLVWDALTSAHTTVNTYGKLLGTFTFTGANVNANAVQWGGNAVGGMPNSTTPPTVGAIATAVMTDVSDTLGGDIVAIKTLTDKVNTMLATSGLNWTYTADALKNAPTGGGSGFTGPSTVTLTFHDSGSNPLQGVQWFVAGVGMGPLSDALGHAVVDLNDGTYSVLVAPINGVTFSTATLVVAGATALTITGNAPTAINPPPTPSQSTAFAYIYDGHGNQLTSKAFYLKLIKSNTGHDIWSNKLMKSSLTATNVAAQITVEIGATYQASVDAQTWSASFTIPNGTTYELTELVGTL